MALTASAPLSAQMPTERKLQVTFDQRVTASRSSPRTSRFQKSWPMAAPGWHDHGECQPPDRRPDVPLRPNSPEAEVIASPLRQTAATSPRPAAPACRARPASRWSRLRRRSRDASSYTPPRPGAGQRAGEDTRLARLRRIPPIVPPGVADPPHRAGATPPRTDRLSGAGLPEGVPCPSSRCSDPGRTDRWRPAEHATARHHGTRGRRRTLTDLQSGP